MSRHAGRRDFSPRVRRFWACYSVPFMQKRVEKTAATQLRPIGVVSGLQHRQERDGSGETTRAGETDEHALAGSCASVGRVFMPLLPAAGRAKEWGPELLMWTIEWTIGVENRRSRVYRWILALRALMWSMGAYCGLSGASRKDYSAGPLMSKRVGLGGKSRERQRLPSALERGIGAN